MKINFKQIFRHAYRNKGASVLNIAGLSVGLVCSIFLAAWIIHESSYDSFIKDKNQMYRVILNGQLNGESIKTGGCFSGIVDEAKQQIPEVIQAIKLSKYSPETLFKTQDNRSVRATGMAADTNFFEMFPYKTIIGDPLKALETTNSIAVTQSLAKRFFGATPAIGNEVLLNRKKYIVSAVLEDIPTNSHLQFDFLTSFKNTDFWNMSDAWGGDNALVYFKTDAHTNVELVNKKITSIVHERAPWAKEIGLNLFLQPLKDIPFSNDFKWDNAKKSSKRNIYILSIVAFFILLIACINFTNLFISNAIKRKKAVGIKITSGAPKHYIIKEFMLEVFTYVLISFVLSMIFIKILNPVFNQLSGTEIHISFFTPFFWMVALPLIAIVSFMSGVFPGIFLTQVNAAHVLKGSQKRAGKMSIQKILVTSQFVITSILLFAVLTINKQVNFLHAKNLGFDKENILYLHTEGKLRNPDEQRKIKQAFLSDPKISTIAYCGEVPSKFHTGALASLATSDYNIHLEHIFVDEDYFDLSNIEFIQGKNVLKQSHDSLNYCILNESALKVLNLKPPYIGKTVYMSNWKGIAHTIMGVIKDVNTKSLEQKIYPCIYTKPKWLSTDGVLMFKLVGDIPSTVKAIQSFWGKEYPELPFEYKFLDETYDLLYKSEERARSIISWFMIIAFILTSLGLLAMVHFITETRIKEIGIRKVNGAKINEILNMLNKDFFKWVVLAFIISCPAAYYLLSSWLENFAYKTALSWWIFASSGIILIGITLVVVTTQTLKAATRNPVEALRYE